MHYKGREKAILEMDLKIDDLLEKVSECFRSRLMTKFHPNVSAKGQQASARPRICAAQCSEGVGLVEEGICEAVMGHYL